MNSYSIELTFTTDRPITEDERQLLLSQVMAQIEEPTDAEGNNSEFKTRLLTFNSKENN
jgi:hypothetical protein